MSDQEQHFVTFEYTEGSHKGGRYWTSYPSKEVFEEKKASGDLCNFNEKIVYDGPDADIASDIAARSTAISLANALAEVDNTEMGSADEAIKVMEAQTVAFALGMALRDGVPQDLPL